MNCINKRVRSLFLLAASSRNLWHERERKDSVGGDADHPARRVERREAEGEALDAAVGDLEGVHGEEGEEGEFEHGLRESS